MGMKNMENIIADNRFKALLLPTVLIAMALNITAIADSMFVSTFVGTNGQAALQVLEPLILLITVLNGYSVLEGRFWLLIKERNLTMKAATSILQYQ